jgi:medium-chain acyl-[acyl-carrier-protein] hydrolase
VNRSAWTVPLHRNEGARMRLLCLPYAAGSAATYRFLTRVLPARLLENLDIWAVEYPGHGERLGEAPYRDFSTLAEAMTGAVAFLFARETAVFGYSLGAMLGFELARRLRDRAGVSPAALLVAACGAPQLAPAGPGITSSPAALTAFLIGQDAGANPHEVAQRWPWHQAVFGVRRTYRYTAGPPLPCPITAFGGAQDEEVSEAALWEWREQTTQVGSFAYHLLAGQQHLFLRQPPFLRLLAGSLLTCVEHSQLQPV